MKLLKPMENRRWSYLLGIGAGAVLLGLTMALTEWTSSPVTSLTEIIPRAIMGIVAGSLLGGLAVWARNSS